MTDFRNGKTYRIVAIGGQVWMAENLDFDYQVDGASYGSYCYNDSAEYCERYGRLYTWAAAMDTLNTGCGGGDDCNGLGCPVSGNARGICPAGWHLPSEAEWGILLRAAGGTATAGSALKSTDGWNDWNGASGNGKDSLGFSALPAGNRHYRPGDSYDLAGEGPFFNDGIDAYFWTSSEVRSTDKASYVSMHRKDSKAEQWTVLKSTDAFSVRCLKD